MIEKVVMYKFLILSVFLFSISSVDAVVPEPLVELSFGSENLLSSGLLGGEFFFTNGGTQNVLSSAVYAQGVAGQGSYALDITNTAYWFSAEIDRQTTSNPYASFPISEGLSGLKSFTVMFWYKGAMLSNASTHLFSGSGSVWNQISRERIDQYGRAFRSVIDNVEYTQSFGWWNAVDTWMLCAYSYDFTTNTERTFSQRINATSPSVVTTSLSVPAEYVSSIMRGVHFGVGINGVIDNIRVYGSKTDSSGFLSSEQVAEIFIGDQVSEVEPDIEVELPLNECLKLHLDASNKDSLNFYGNSFRPGSKVSVWSDISGNNHNFVQPDIDNAPVWIDRIPSLNGLSALQFDGIDDFMACANLSLEFSNTLFIVVQDTYQRPDAEGVPQTQYRSILSSFGNPYGDGAEGFGLGYIHPGDSNIAFVKGLQGFVAENINDFSGRFCLIIVSIDSNGNVKMYSQSSGDVLPIELAGACRFSAISQPVSGYYLCNGLASGNGNYRGYIAEVAKYNRNLSTEELLQVSGYFYDKYFCKGVDKFGAQVYLDFEGNLKNRGISGAEQGQFTTVSNTTPRFTKGLRGYSMDTSDAVMGAAGGCAVFGTDGTDNTKIEQALNGLSSFTVTGWFNTGNSISLKSYTGFLGRLGQLYVRSYDDYSRLVLGVNNKWTAADPAIAYPEQNKWVFWAVSYDGSISSNNVKWYKGTLASGLQYLKSNSLDAGVLNNSDGQLAIGNLLPSGSYSFSGLTDEIRIFGSKIDSSGFITFDVLEEIFDDGCQKICASNEIIGDINGDCRVDLADMAELLWTYGASTYIPVE